MTSLWEKNHWLSNKLRIVRVVQVAEAGTVVVVVVAEDIEAVVTVVVADIEAAATVAEADITAIEIVIDPNIIDIHPRQSRGFFCLPNKLLPVNFIIKSC